MAAVYDVLIVGAGFAGLTIAERLCTRHGLRCLLVERRSHIGGNAYDHLDDHGVRIHAYGPHYFRTNSDRVVEYLSRFTDWHPVQYRVKSFTDGRYWSFPINLETFEQFIGRSATSEEMERWLAERRVPIDRPANSEEIIVSQVGWELYEKFFKGYTLKQWKRHPRDLSPSVCGRIPIRTTRDDRYLRERFQALPSAGYSALFDRMVAACGDALTVMLDTDYREIAPNTDFRHLVYTGPIDEFYDYAFGDLPYRSLRFEKESFTPGQLAERQPISGKAGFWQPAMQVNYPNDEDFTRIVEIKHATGQDCDNTTIVREYPQDYTRGREPYYPVPSPDAEAIYEKYQSLAADGTLPGVFAAGGISRAGVKATFVGRLATYRYYNMDQVVALALEKAEQIGEMSRKKGLTT